jgi:hypothetical protein
MPLNLPLRRRSPIMSILEEAAAVADYETRPGAHAISRLNGFPRSCCRGYDICRYRKFCSVFAGSRRIVPGKPKWMSYPTLNEQQIAHAK